MYIFTKLLVFILCLCVLDVIREALNFFLVFRSGDRKLDISKGRLWLLGLSLSYILTIIFTGFKLF